MDVIFFLDLLINNSWGYRNTCIKNNQKQFKKCRLKENLSILMVKM